jgi:ferric-dicitrate binding protein FerR (iron transport regulator)
MTTDNEWIRLARFVSGECSPEEAEATRRWIAARPEREQLTESLREISATSALDPRDWDTSAAWERLVVRAERLGASPAPSQKRRAPRGIALSIARQRPPRHRWLRAGAVAASVLLVAAGGIWVGNRGALPGWWSAPAQEAAPREFTTARAQLAEVRLSDGSTVVLAAESRLSVPAAYGSAHREVTLDGEAYFDVVHDDRRPFVVRAGQGVVHDLGTKFAVRHYSGEGGVRVVVTEGRVMLRADDTRPATGPVLEQGDLGQLDSTGTIAVTRGVDVGRYIGWTQGRLTFYDAPLPEVLAQLDRWYDVRFTLGDQALRARRITMSLPTTSVDGLVDALGLTLDLRAERRGDTIVLRQKAR